MTLSKILIANRGEIACRIIRTANRLGIKCVSVFSDADRDSLHVKMADEAIYIGKPPAQQSYLIKEKIIESAKKTSCQAIHPGYGFLSESYEFSQLCSKNDLVFIGPPWKAIRDMGIKSTSKHIMSAARVPIIEGYHGEDQNEERLLQEAEKIGYPVMIKAVRGGGGKGMRIAFNREEFIYQLQSAKTEALKAFNNDEMLVEKFVEKPRHVEVQIFGDHHSNYVYLYERDCSVQRRHQKIIEETPAPGLTEETRRRIGEAAVQAARAVNYVGAGTVEFIMDPNQNFYFMEMNTRLQVEHPITEMVTNTDLVEWQIRVARGERLPLKQEEIPLKGHAFEARIYAEDPNNNFMPGAGKLKYLQAPLVTDKNIRVETGVEEGDEVSVHYDPLIAKLVVWSDDRKSALQKFRYALANYKISGLTTNIPFIISLCDHKEFIDGNVHTDFIPMHKDELFKTAKQPNIDNEIVCCALSTIINYEAEVSKNNSNNNLVGSVVPNFWTNNFTEKKFDLVFSNESKTSIKVSVKFLDENNFELGINGLNHVVNLNVLDKQARLYQCEIDGHRIKLSYSRDQETGIFNLFANDKLYEFKLDDRKYQKEQNLSLGDAGSNDSIAPMPGVVDKINVKAGDVVKKGDPLVVMIAMKMEYVIRTNRDGVVKSINCSVGQNVKKSHKLVSLAE
ncbi:methylcrotonoyl- carboxylase subunit mitochondrial [Brachionus plicatilis]|uniref:Methylcrotonoyl-carboxylase subunit mitochondrial n=1 Tax=Brachionus plicatilis TaxID=10195 RepID=A0A3M7T6Q0_BRAPC|nr:methylcrotonoyl- carboxylase subunit mitochondrial [Brachionus plicatilis]